MGNCHSFESQFYYSGRDGKEIKRIANHLGLKFKTVFFLYQKFVDIDVDNSGSISAHEFLMHFDLERTPFALRAFTLLDDSQSGTLSFPEFLCAFWNYCTFDFPSLVEYSFNLFDSDGSKEMDMDEVKDMVSYMYSGGLSAKTQLIVDSLDEDRSGTISLGEWTLKIKKFPSLLYPAFRMQQMMREAAGGVSFWQRATEERFGRHGDSTNLMDVLMSMGELSTVEDSLFMKKVAEAKLNKELEFQRAKEELLEEEKLKKIEYAKKFKRRAKQKETEEKYASSPGTAKRGIKPKLVSAPSSSKQIMNDKIQRMKGMKTAGEHERKHVANGSEVERLQKRNKSPSHRHAINYNDLEVISLDDETPVPHYQRSSLTRRSVGEGGRQRQVIRREKSSKNIARNGNISNASVGKVLACSHDTTEATRTIPRSHAWKRPIHEVY